MLLTIITQNLPFLNFKEVKAVKRKFINPQMVLVSKKNTVRVTGHVRLQREGESVVAKRIW